MSIYFITQDRPILSVGCMSLAMSIKAGALLLLPSVFGWIHYFYGTFMLLESVALFVFTQVLLASPFCDDSAARLMGFSSANTGWEEYSKFIFGGRMHGANAHCLANFWNKQMISEELYDSWTFVNIMKFMMLATNVVFFFVKFNALP